ncbi:S49 family peptidase [Pseudomonas sp. R5(2019)]|uniref:S49 family peptidase n=1 Tax=Pseudomonas sp. R5(2019) TaxID=2697566 RepID=UPI0014136945|nr:S49 family peptidase [Pseudomonas sp. R5(2019)]NBA98614.1 S49 family peptidase [Pseudomonas sp. R5(2019)]
MEDKELGNVLREVLLENLREKRRARWWSVSLKLLFFAYLVVSLYLYATGYLWGSKDDTDNLDQYTGLVTLNGEINATGPNGYLEINKALRKAFEDPKTKGVILSINSPGGSPVQSHQIHAEMQRLQQQYPDKPLYAVIGDIGASGGYFVATGAKVIYADPSSLIGSIGVTSAGFGFVDILGKLGIERRNYTSGEHKSLLDPYSPQNPQETEFWNSQLQMTHHQFIAAVMQGRGDRLKADTPNLFSGYLWNAQAAKDIGLIDGYGSIESVARDLIKAEHLKKYGEKSNAFGRLVDKFGVAVGAGFANASLQQLNLDSNTPAVR